MPLQFAFRSGRSSQFSVSTSHASAKWFSASSAAIPKVSKMAINVIAAFLPAAIIGLLFEKPIKKYLFGGEAWGLWPIVAAWFFGGVAILAVSWWQSSRQTKTHQSGLSLESLTWKMAVVVGLIQCIAMWPGVSRSLVTIVGGVIVGLSLPAAVEFSFLLGLLTLTAATVYDGLKYGQEMVHSFGLSRTLLWLSRSMGFSGSRSEMDGGLSQEARNADLSAITESCSPSWSLF